MQKITNIIFFFILLFPHCYFAGYHEYIHDTKQYTAIPSISRILKGKIQLNRYNAHELCQIQQKLKFELCKDKPRQKNTRKQIIQKLHNVHSCMKKKQLATRRLCGNSIQSESLNSQTFAQDLLYVLSYTIYGTTGLASCVYLYYYLRKQHNLLHSHHKLFVRSKAI